MNWKPKPWLAFLLNLIGAPFGFLYAGRARWALAFVGIALALLAVQVFQVIRAATAEAGVLLQSALVIGAAVTAYRGARTARAGVRPWYSHWYGLVGLACAFALVVFAFRVFFYEPFKVPSSSMEPTAEPGTIIIVQKLGYGHFSSYGLRLGSRPISAQLKRGDMIVFDFPVDPSQTFVKRIVGLPGDRVVYRNKHAIVNGRDSRIRRLGDYADPKVPRYLPRFRDKLDNTEFDTVLQDDRPPLAGAPSDFPFRDRCTYGADWFSCDVPAGNYFVMGDNRDNTLDSRYWGFVRSNLIIGKVVKMLQ